MASLYRITATTTTTTWGKSIVKGMYVEIVSSVNPLGDSRMREEISRLFENKYGREAAINPSSVSGSFFKCEKIG